VRHEEEEIEAEVDRSLLQSPNNLWTTYPAGRAMPQQNDRMLLAPGDLCAG
jgi:hypothetical protein